MAECSHPALDTHFERPHVDPDRVGWAQTWESETFEAQINGQTYVSVVLSTVVPL